jgi:zinc ribbon protein
VYCVHCGAENPGDATFCQKCGKQLPTTVQDEPTVSSIPSSLSTPYDNTPYSNSPSALAETVYAPPPPPSNTPMTNEKASPPGLQPAQKRKRRWALILSLVIIALVAIIAVGGYVYLNRSTPDKTVTTYYSALVHNDFQTAYDQLSTAAQGSLSEQRFTQIWQGLGGVKAWTLVSTQEQVLTANSTVTITFGNGQIRLASILLVDENGTWKIQKETIAVS